MPRSRNKSYISDISRVKESQVMKNGRELNLIVFFPPIIGLVRKMFKIKCRLDECNNGIPATNLCWYDENNTLDIELRKTQISILLYQYTWTKGRF